MPLSFFQLQDSITHSTYVYGTASKYECLYIAQEIVPCNRVHVRDVLPKAVHDKKKSMIVFIQISSYRMHMHPSRGVCTACMHEQYTMFCPCQKESPTRYLRVVWENNTFSSSKSQKSEFFHSIFPARSHAYVQSLSTILPCVMSYAYLPSAGLACKQILL